MSLFRVPLHVLLLEWWRGSSWTDWVRLLGPEQFRYDLALIYLKHADYDLDKAVEAYKSDEKWEREHPLKAARKGKRNLR